MSLKPKRGKTGAVMRRLGAHVWLSRGLTLVLVLIIFAAGVGTGNGRLGVLLHRNYAPASGDLPNNLDYSSVNAVYQSLKENYNGKLTADQLTDGLKHGLAEATKDPYTVYFTSKEAQDFNSELNQSLTGIGAQLEQETDKSIVVVSPLAGSPAEAAGLKALDIVSQVDGKSTAGLSLNEVVKEIRGKKGTAVKLQVVRDKANLMEFTITRDDIKVPSVTSKILDNNIGYMQISSFSDNTTLLAQQAADKFAAAHVKGIILDLRDDGGGYLDAAVSVSSLWLPKDQLIMQEKRGSVVTNTYQAAGGNELHNIPTVVLVNGGSASASEITTGALHDNKAAYVIGEKSYGKGVVQSLINFKDGAQLKVTIASWYRPDGENINHKGINPDKTVKQSDADTANKVDTQLEAAKTYLAK
jgi:carboxyl-terminal processing protease